MDTQHLHASNTLLEQYKVVSRRLSVAPVAWAPEEGRSRGQWCECCSRSVYVIHTAGAGEGLTLHRPPQLSGNDFCECKTPPSKKKKKPWPALWECKYDRKRKEAVGLLMCIRQQEPPCLYVFACVHKPFCVCLYTSHGCIYSLFYSLADIG